MSKTSARGRPSAYDPKFVDMMIKYFDISILSDEGKVNDLPTLAGFAGKIGVHRDTLHEWATALESNKLKYPDFSDAYKRAKDFQEHLLVNGTLKGYYAAAPGIFAQKNLLGFRDKQKDEAPDIQVNNYSGLTTDQLEERALELAKKIVEKKKP